MKMCVKSILLLMAISVSLKCVQSADSSKEQKDSKSELSSGLIETVPDSKHDVGEEDDNTRSNQKNNFSEPRFAQLFNARSRRPRISEPRHISRPKPTLPSFIRNTPALQPVTFAPPPAPTARAVVAARTAKTTAAPIRTTASSRTRNSRNERTTSTTTSASARRSRTREQSANSGQVASSSAESPQKRRFGGTFKSTTPRN